VIDNQTIHKDLLDLGASTNLPLFIAYEKFRVGELRPTKIVLYLADRSTRLLRGVVKDVLIKVREFIFLIGLAVLDTEGVCNAKSHILVNLGTLS